MSPGLFGVDTTIRYGSDFSMYLWETSIASLAWFISKNDASSWNTIATFVNRNLEKDVCANHNYGTEENLTYAVRRYLRCKGSWPKL